MRLSKRKEGKAIIHDEVLTTLQSGEGQHELTSVLKTDRARFDLRTGIDAVFKAMTDKEKAEEIVDALSSDVGQDAVAKFFKTPYGTEDSRGRTGPSSGDG